MEFLGPWLYVAGATLALVGWGVVLVITDRPKQHDNSAHTRESTDRARRPRAAAVAR